MSAMKNVITIGTVAAMVAMMAHRNYYAPHIWTVIIAELEV